MSDARVLYIDDEVDLLDLAASFFEEENVPVDTCSDFHLALEMIRNKKYDLIISDAKMPSGSGHDLFRIIRTEYLFTGKVMLVTGNLQTTEDTSTYDYVIYKPIEFQELVAIVKSLLK